jgi:ribosomal protein S12 methylthiotransferase accessory factor
MMLDAKHGRAAADADAIARSDLRRLGFADPLDAADGRLLALLSAFDLKLQLGRALDGRAWIAAAVWEPRDGTDGDVFGGAGFQPADAIRSCLGEFAEFQSWLFRPGDATRHGAAATRTIDAWTVLGFSERQRAEGCDDIPDRATFAGEIDWSRATCLNDGLAWELPAQLCFGRHAQRMRSRSPWRSDSNGCAAGKTPGDARRAALLELIERDAAGIWWYGRCRRPGVGLARFDTPELKAALEARRQSGQALHLLDLTHDLRVPVVAAVLLQGGRLSGLGFGCKPSLEAAAVSAYLELCQMELSIAIARQRAGREDEPLLRWLEGLGVDEQPHLQPANSDAMLAREPVFDDLVQRLLSIGLRTYAVDLTRADIGIPAVRLFAPGLCHDKPRLGHQRLVTVPRALGWREPGFSAADLNQTPLPL